MKAILRKEVTAGRLGGGFALLAAITFGLITLGALVRANAAGLACPDWPLCFGEFIPQLDVKVAFEWGHRLLAGMVSTGLLVLTVLACLSPALRGQLVWRLVVVWGLLAVQVVFGGLTVLHRLAPWTVSGHLLLGNSFCLALAWISADLFEVRREATARLPLSSGFRVLATATAFSLSLQLLLGGLVSGHFAGLACADFPTCDGASFAPSFSGIVGLHVLHRLNGLALFAGFAALAWVTRGTGRIGKLSRLGFALVALQIGLGAANVLLRLPVEITALHTATAAAIVLTTALLMREIVMAGAAARRRRPVEAAVRMLEA